MSKIRFLHLDISNTIFSSSFKFKVAASSSFLLNVFILASVFQAAFSSLLQPLPNIVSCYICSCSRSLIKRSHLLYLMISLHVLTFFFHMTVFLVLWYFSRKFFFYRFSLEDINSMIYLYSNVTVSNESSFDESIWYSRLKWHRKSRLIHFQKSLLCDCPIIIIAWLFSYRELVCTPGQIRERQVIGRHWTTWKGTAQHDFQKVAISWEEMPVVAAKSARLRTVLSNVSTGAGGTKAKVNHSLAIDNEAMNSDWSEQSNCATCNILRGSLTKGITRAYLCCRSLSACSRKVTVLSLDTLSYRTAVVCNWEAICQGKW